MKYDMPIEKRFMRVKDTCALTGLSKYYLRNGCKDGSIPHVKSGNVIYIDVPRLMEKLGDAE